MFQNARQRKLEQAFLFSGQFKEGVKALFEWLDSVKPSLADENKVPGDLNSDNALNDQYEVGVFNKINVLVLIVLGQ